MNTQKGFTLIELVMVIVILGILAAFAVPRFADITVDARKATVQSLTGSVRSAAALAHATALAQSRSASETISMDGQQVTMINFYPTSSPNASGSIAGGIVAALADISGFTTTLSGTADTIYFRKVGATNEAACWASYQAPATTNSSPTISIRDTNC